VKTISKGASGGSFVSDLSVPAAAWMRRMRANRRELENLVEYRAAVETAAAYLAAQRREDEDLVHLRASIEDLVHFEAGDDADSKPALRRCDSTFHNTVGCASGNRMLEHAIKVSRGKFFFPFDLLASGGSRDSTIRDHEAIASAIEHRRPRQASAAMEVHIEHTRTRLREILTRLG
jgi:DNA-binding FadR family transcriptional regulator